MNATLDLIKKYFRSKPLLNSFYKALKSFKDRVKEHLITLRFLVRVVVPIILRTKSRPVLFFRYVGIGDIICTFPAIKELKKRHPDRVFIYSCHPEFACLPKMGGITSEVVSLRCDIIKDYWSFLFVDIYAFLHDVGFDYKPMGGAINEVSVIEEFASQHQVSVANSHPGLQVEPAVLARVESLLKKKTQSDGPLIVIHCGPSWRVREFPHASWSELIDRLRLRGFTNIVQVGTSEHSCIGPVDSMVFPNVVSLVDQLTLEESIAVTALCKLFIGIDSGLLHVVAALRIPGIGLFGATSPQYRFGKTSSCTFVISDVDCQGCHHRTPRLHFESGCPFDIACMKEMRVENVLVECLSRLDSASSQTEKLNHL